MQDLMSSDSAQEGSGLARRCGEDLRSCSDHHHHHHLLPETECTKWTDEKHSLYLNSMETSFVNQLYDSLDTLGWTAQGECSSDHTLYRQQLAGIPTPSGHFKVFKDGSWTFLKEKDGSLPRINLRRHSPRPKQAYEAGNILANPWIQHYRSLSRHETRASIRNPESVSFAASPHKLSSSCLQTDTDPQDSVNTNAEVMDQNFVDEVSKAEKPSKRKNMKCRKSSGADNWGHDQVVPFKKLSLQEGLAQGHQQFKD